jgi:hypothetical protein
MSRDHANKPNSFVPVLLAAGAALVGSIFSAAAIALDEDQAFKREEGAIFAAASVIACNLLDGRSTKKRVGDKSDDLQRPRNSPNTWPPTPSRIMPPLLTGYMHR